MIVLISYGKSRRLHHVFWVRPQQTDIQVRCDTWDSHIFCVETVAYFSKNPNPDYLFHFLLTGSADHITVPAQGFRALAELNPNRWALDGQLILCLQKNLADFSFWRRLCCRDQTGDSLWSSAKFSKSKWQNLPADINVTACTRIEMLYFTER